jgi:hypothetical protein
MPAFAGSVSGPEVILVNLSDNAGIEQKIKDIVDTGNISCWNPDAELFIRRRPQGMTNNLILSGLIQKQKASIRKLDKLLRKPDGDIDKGYDGIVVYVEKPKRKFITLVSTFLSTIDTDIPLSTTEDGLIKAFCEALPPVTRKP